MSTEIEVKTDTEVQNDSLEEPTEVVDISMASEGTADANSERPKKPRKWKASVLRICIDGMLTAMFIGLTFLKIRIGNVQISFAAIPLVFATVGCGLPDGLIVAFLGSFVEQLISPYGLTITTPLWLLPHMVRALVLWLFDFPFKRKGKNIYDNIPIYFVGMIVSALFLTGANTLVMWLDALIIGYPIEFLMVETVIRFAVGMLSAVIVALVVLPVMKVLKKNGFLEKLKL